MVSPIKRRAVDSSNSRIYFFDDLPEELVFEILKYLPKINVEAFGLTSRNNLRLSRMVMPLHKDCDEIVRIRSTIAKVVGQIPQLEKDHGFIIETKESVERFNVLLNNFQDPYREVKRLYKEMKSCYKKQIAFMINAFSTFMVKTIGKAIFKPLEKGEEKRICKGVDVTFPSRKSSEKQRLIAPFENIFAEYKGQAMKVLSSIKEICLSYKKQLQTSGRILKNHKDRLRIAVNGFERADLVIFEKIGFHSYKHFDCFRKMFDEKIEKNIKEYGINLNKGKSNDTKNIFNSAVYSLRNVKRLEVSSCRNLNFLWGFSNSVDLVNGVNLVSGVFAAWIGKNLGDDLELIVRGGVFGETFSGIAYKFKSLMLLEGYVFSFSARCWENLKTLYLETRTFSRLPNLSEMKRLEDATFYFNGTYDGFALKENRVCLKRSESLKYLKIKGFINIKGRYLWWDFSSGFPELRRLSFEIYNHISDFRMEYFPKLRSFEFDIKAKYFNFDTHDMGVELKKILTSTKCAEKEEKILSKLSSCGDFRLRIQKHDCVKNENWITVLKLDSLNKKMELRGKDFPYLKYCYLKNFKVVTVSDSPNLKKIEACYCQRVKLDKLRSLDFLRLDFCEKMKITNVDKISVFALKVSVLLLTDSDSIDCSLKVVDIFALFLEENRNKKNKIASDLRAFSQLNFKAKHLEIILGDSRSAGDFKDVFRKFPRISGIQSIDFYSKTRLKEVRSKFSDAIKAFFVPLKERLVDFEFKALRYSERREAAWVEFVDKKSVECIHVCRPLGKKNLDRVYNFNFRNLKYFVVNKDIRDKGFFKEKIRKNADFRKKVLPEGSFQELLEGYFCSVRRVFNV